MKTSKDSNGNWAGSYKGIDFVLYNLKEGWSWSIRYYSPIFEEEQLYNSSEDYPATKTKKEALVNIKEAIEEKNKSNSDFMDKRADKKKLSNGGGLGDNIDLFEHYDKQPAKLSKIVEKYSSDESDYSDTEKFLKEVEAIGYTFDYGLDNEPYNLRKIGTQGNTELMKEGGGVDKVKEQKISNGLHSVEVMFKNPKYNYRTSVSPNSTEKSARDYFVGQFFDVGVYPKEQMEEVIDIKFFKNPNTMETIDYSEEKFSKGGQTSGWFNGELSFLNW